MFGTSIPWPNPQNSLEILYNFFTGQTLEPGTGWHSILFLVQESALIGELLCIPFLLIFLYYHMQTEALHHHLAEARHEKAEGIAHVAEAHAKENPNRARWERIVAHMSSGNVNDWRSAIIDADVMLDALLTERGFVGQDIGEKFQSASRGPFASIEAAWDAHRTRNRIAHAGADFTLSDREARAAIDGYRRVFEEFGYI
ncbi:MAG: hypothetical protein ACREGH_01165 [Minisyncoccia bacterium]